MPVVYPTMNPAATTPNPTAALEGLKKLNQKPVAGPHALTGAPAPPTRNDEGPFGPNPYSIGTPYGRRRG